MSKSKATLVELGKDYGIFNGADMSYSQLTNEIRAAKNGGELPPVKKRKMTKAEFVVNEKLAYKPKTSTFKVVGKVELRKGLLRYYYVIKGKNGEITSTSQKYFSKSNAVRAAVEVARLNKYAFTRKT